MKKILFFLILIFTTGIIFGQSKEYKGTVKEKRSKAPIPGVTVIIKGTKIGTLTDFEGNFKITVPDSLDILNFSSIGFESLDFKIKESQSLEVLLKYSCSIDWFDAQRIGIYINSGAINNPIGGQFYFSLPAIFGQPTLKSGISYQSNLKENRFLNTYLSIEHLFASCEPYFSTDMNTSYRNLDFDNKLDLSAYSIETSLNFSRISVIIGYSSIDFLNSEENLTIKSSGVTLGLGVFIGKPFLISVTGKTSMYKNINEYHAEIKTRHKRIYGFMKYYKVNDFNELSIGIGTEFTYLFKNQRQ